MFSRDNLLLTALIAILSFTNCTADEVWVTGDPAEPAFLKSVLLNRGWTEFPSKSLSPGSTWKSKSGDTVINLDWRAPKPALAALSDHPEKVERPGGLFFGGLTPLRPLLFQYYHLGKMMGPEPNIVLVVSNPGAEDSVLYLQQGIGNPSLDYFSSGHTNNIRWFAGEQSNQGEFLTIGAGKTLTIFEQELKPEYVVSGTLGLTVLEGSPLQFAFVARKNKNDEIALNNLLKKDDVHSRGFYPVPLQTLRRTFQAGSPAMNLVVGAIRQQTFSGVRELRGDYGVIYDMELTVTNPTDSAKTVELVFNPRGGKATASILVDGQLVEIGETEAFKEVRFHQISLPPESTQTLDLRTIPEGASSYPVRIVVR